MNKINVVIPMAGAGSRFSQQGYILPKPFIPVKDKMMIEWVLDGVRLDNANYHLIIRDEFKLEYTDFLDKLSSKYNVAFSSVAKVTKGASCTVLSIHQLINNDTPLLILDSDNFFYENVLCDFVSDAQQRDLDGSLLTFKSNKPQFSYVALNEHQLASDIVEKEVISENAICGAYYFKSGKDFVNTAIELMIYGETQKGEYYLSGVFSHLLKERKIGIYAINSNQWDCVGTPEQLESFLKNEE